MKTNLAITFLLVINLSFGQTQHLFKITQNDRVGYINEQGAVVIKPIYLNGNEFSEGLAAVRLNGTYGFIDETGTFVIQPVYEFATKYINGITIVYKNGAPLFIGKTGNTVLPEVYKGFTYLDAQKGIVNTLTNRKGIMNIATKQLLIDTVFSSISEFTNGVAIVREYIPPEQDGEKRLAVIDTTGKLVVPFGKYETINPFYEGYATVEIEDKQNKSGSTDGAIDTKGNLLFAKSYTNGCYVAGDFHDGLARVGLYKYSAGGKGGTSTSGKSYDGYMNLKGEVVLNDPKYKNANDFSNGRAFVKEEDKGYILMDRNFKQVGNKTYQSIPLDIFRNGYAIVRTSGGAGIIDTSGNFITHSTYGDISQVGIVDGYFFYADNGYSSKQLYGISDLKGNIIAKPVMQDFDRAGFVNGLIKAEVDNKFSYINKSGVIVWQEKKDTSTALKPLNIDFMNRGYFYAYSTPENTGGEYSSGWATSQNTPHKITNTRFPGKSLAITIDTGITGTFAKQYFGYKLFVSNTTADTIKFNAQDSRLYMKLQAQNEKGEWKDIEYLPSSWCGNSYHKIELEPNAYWSFTIPKYTGDLQTKIRAELTYIDKNNPKKEKTVYSNIISGSINPAQFWNKRTYFPSGIMDPYND